MSALSPAAGLALRAKRLEMQAAHRLAARIALVDALRECIHALQRERGASSLYLASGGVRFAGERHGAIAAGAPALERLAALLAAQGDAAGAQTSSGSAADADVDAPMLCHMAWVLLGVEALPAQRAAIEARQTSAQDAIAAYSQCIAGMVQLLSHVADASLLPGLHSVSHALVALLHLVQAKEAAGQERAAGAQMLASGRCEAAPQERIVHLIDAQEQGLRVYADFAGAALRAEWEGLQLGPGMVRLERLRRVLCAARPGAVLDTAASEEWFTVTSERIGALAACEATLVHHLRTECAHHAAQARQELQDSEGLLRRLREAPPAVPPLPGGEASALHGLLQAQAERLQRTETELQAARRALAERRVIERAKGVLMERLGLSEEAAFRTLQKASMDQNRRLLDVAEAALALPGLVSARAKEI